MSATVLSPQMNLEPLELLEWGDGEFPLLDNSHSSEMANDPLYFDALTSLAEGRDVQDEGPEPSSYPANDMAFTQASVSFCTAQADPQYSSPNLDHNGIDPRLPHSDTLTRFTDSASREQCMRRSMQPINVMPLAYSQPHLQAPSLPPRGYARNQWEQRTPEARVRPQTAMPAVTTEDGMHMPFIPERPNNMQRTRSCPSNGHHYPPPMQMAIGASPQEGQSWHFTPSRVSVPERPYRGCIAPAQSEDDPDSPPRRKGKGGRQRAPAPDASVDPKRAKRIMANRASAAKSKEKQKQKVQELERQKSAKEAEILALQHANKTHEGQCKALQNQLTELNDLEQDYTRLQCLNRKLTEFHSVLQKALKDSQGLSWNGQNQCQSQNAYSGAPVSVHAFNSITMPSGRPVHKGPKVDPNTPDMEVPPFLELSESYEQANCMGSTSPSDLHQGSAR